MNNTSTTGPVKSIALTGSDQAVATAQVFYGMIITNESGAAMNLHVHNGRLTLGQQSSLGRTLKTTRQLLFGTVQTVSLAPMVFILT